MNLSLITGRTKNSRACFDNGGEQLIVGRLCIYAGVPNLWIERAVSRTHDIFVKEVLLVSGHIALHVVLLDSVTHLVKTSEFY